MSGHSPLACALYEAPLTTASILTGATRFCFRFLRTLHYITSKLLSLVFNQGLDPNACRRHFPSKDPQTGNVFGPYVLDNVEKR